MAGFPLHRLPLLPLKNVLDYINLADLIRFHLCSKKTRDLLRLMNKSVTFDSLSQSQKDSMNILETLYLLRLEVYNNPSGSVGCFPEKYVTTTITIASDDRIELNVSRDYFQGNRYLSCPHLLFLVERNTHDRPLRTKKYNFGFDGITVPVWTNKETIHTYWEDQSVGLTVLVNYFKKFFNAHTIKYIIKGSKDPMFSENLRMVINGMAQQTISTCEIHSDNMNNDDYKFILDNVNPTHLFRQESNLVSRNYYFQHNISFKSEYFTLKPANWFTFDNLIMLDCKNINLLQTRFSNDDMCEYLKLWMDGDFSNLEHLTVQLPEIVNLSYIHTVLEEHLETIYVSGVEQHPERYTIVSSGDQIHIQWRKTTIANIKSVGYQYWPQNVFSFSIK